MMDRSTDKNTEKRKENKKTYRGRLVAAFVVVLVTTLLEIIYYGYHIMDNRDNVVHSFKNEQDSTAQIIADGLAGKSEDAMIHFIRHSVPVSGTTWGFILKDGRVLYMKDDDTTKNLENISSKAEFELYMEDLGGIVSEASVSGTEYVCGVFTDKDYVLEEYGTSNIEFYIVTAVIATILVFGCILIEFAGRIGHEGRKVIALQSDLTERNEKFDEYERLTDQYEEELRNRDFDKTEIKREGYYDLEIVDTLLSKSSDTELFPITFMFIRVRMGDRYFSRDAIFRIMDFIKGSMGKNHVTAELSKGYFVVIMYKTDLAAAEKLAADGIDAKVINIHTIKPIDEELIVAAAKETGKVVTVEEHSVIGGLGGAVAEALSEEAPTKMLRIGMMDKFGQSGPAKALIEYYGLDGKSIYEKVKAFL